MITGYKSCFFTAALVGYSELLIAPGLDNWIEKLRINPRRKTFMTLFLLFIIHF